MWNRERAACAEAVSVDLLEIPTSDLVDELKRRSDSSVIMLALVGDCGERIYNYYRDGEIIVQLGLVEAQRKQILDALVTDDLNDED